MSDNKPVLGFLNINKPKGMTSHDVVSRIRKVAGIKQVGHTGTLDPFATGVLPIAIGKATKLIEYLNDDKEYIATVQFGANTATYDLEGEIIETFDTKVTKEMILKALKNFEGEISQVPPIYSALKINGKKLYDYARAGEQVEIKPRTVNIYKIELFDFNYELQQAKIIIACSKGTYIRSIAYDLGKILNCGGYLISLERSQAGKFNISSSVNLDEISTTQNIIKYLVNPIDVMDFPTKELNDKEREKVLHGMPILNDSFKFSDIVFLTYSGKIVAIGMVSKDKILVKKVFEVL